MPKNFVDSGAASSLLAVAEYGNVPLAPSQRELTPLQRLVIQLEAKRQHDEASSGDTPPVQNSMAKPGATMQGETIEYVNEGM